jgi:hypothetical protein
MAAKKWIAGAIKNPGVEQRKAKANGISTQEQLSRDAKSSDPTTRKRGVLGKTLTRLAKRRKKS